MKKFRAWDVEFKKFRNEFDWVVDPETGFTFSTHYVDIEERVVQSQNHTFLNNI